MGRGQRQTDDLGGPTLRGSAQDEERAEIVSITLWVERSLADESLVDVRVAASGHDADLRNAYDVPEADGLEAEAEPLSLEGLRAVLNRDLARGVARELQVPYESRSGIEG